MYKCGFQLTTVFVNSNGILNNNSVYILRSKFAANSYRFNSMLNGSIVQLHSYLCYWFYLKKKFFFLFIPFLIRFHLTGVSNLKWLTRVKEKKIRHTHLWKPFENENKNVTQLPNNLWLKTSVIQFSCHHLSIPFVR